MTLVQNPNSARPTLTLLGRKPIALAAFKARLELKIVEPNVKLFEKSAVGLTKSDRLKFNHIAENFSGNISETARRLCMHRRTLQRIVKRAERAGINLTHWRTP